MTWTSAVLVERLNGDEKLARELVKIFLLEYLSLLEAIRSSIAVGDATSIRRAAHAFKGCAANFVDTGPTTTALDIERAAQASQLGDVAGLLLRLEREVEELAGEMRRSLGTTSCAS